MFMKDNHISVEERLSRRISRMEMRLDSDEAWGQYGDGNPYWYCKGCNKAEPEISISGHGKGCWVAGLEKEIEYYKNLLTGCSSH